MSGKPSGFTLRDAGRTFLVAALLTLAFVAVKAAIFPKYIECDLTGYDYPSWFIPLMTKWVASGLSIWHVLIALLTAWILSIGFAFARKGDKLGRGGGKKSKEVSH
jgi:hypothetical protein